MLALGYPLCDNRNKSLSFVFSLLCYADNNDFWPLPVASRSYDDLTHLLYDFISKVEKEGKRWGSHASSCFFSSQEIKLPQTFVLLPSYQELGLNPLLATKKLEDQIFDVRCCIPYCGGWAREKGTEFGSGVDQWKLSAISKEFFQQGLVFLGSSLLTKLIFKHEDSLC